MEQRRFLYMDVLRVCAFLFVVLLHAITPTITNNDLLGTFAWTFSVAANALARMGVPLFLMLTGALLLGREEEAPGVLAFYRRRLPRILVPLLVWNVFYTVFTYCTEGTPLESIFTIFLTGLLNQGTYYHLWYLYQIFGIYLLLPFLDRVCRHSTLKEAALLTAIAVFPGTLRPFLNTRLPVYLFLFGPLLEGYLGYVLLGYLLSRLRPTRTAAALAGASLVLGICLSLYDNIAPSLAGGTVTLNANGGYALSSFLSAGGLFLLVRRLLENRAVPERPQRVLARLSAATYAAYGLHAAVLFEVQKLPLTGPLSLIMLETAALTALISLAAALLLQLTRPARFLFG